MADETTNATTAEISSTIPADPAPRRGRARATEAPAADPAPAEAAPAEPAAPAEEVLVAEEDTVYISPQTRAEMEAGARAIGRG